MRTGSEIGTEVAQVARMNELIAYVTVPQTDADALFGSPDPNSKLRPDAKVELRLIGDPSQRISSDMVHDARAIPARLQLRAPRTPA